MTTSVLYDEAGTITGRMVGPPTLNVMQMPMPKKPTVRPIQVHCRYCGAEPGASCQKFKLGRRGKYLVDREPHPDRKHVARLATQALRALT